MIPHPRERRPKPRHPIGTLVATHRGPGTVVQNTWYDNVMHHPDSTSLERVSGWLTTVEVEDGECVADWESHFKEIKP